MNRDPEVLSDTGPSGRSGTCWVHKNVHKINYKILVYTIYTINLYKKYLQPDVIPSQCLLYIHIQPSRSAAPTPVTPHETLTWDPTTRRHRYLKTTLNRCFLYTTISLWAVNVKCVFKWQCPNFHLLTHWGQVTHICVSKLTIIGSDNGLSPGQRQAIIWTNDG